MTQSVATQYAWGSPVIIGLLQPVFLIAVPVALVAFALSWFLREVPLRAAAAGASDIGEGLGAGSAERSSVDEVERALSRLAGADIRRRGYERLALLAGLDLPAGSCWAWWCGILQVPSG
jgi:hypothetical protein